MRRFRTPLANDGPDRPRRCCLNVTPNSPWMFSRDACGSGWRGRLTVGGTHVRNESTHVSRHRRGGRRSGRARGLRRSGRRRWFGARWRGAGERPGRRAGLRPRRDHDRRSPRGHADRRVHLPLDHGDVPRAHRGAEPAGAAAVRRPRGEPGRARDRRRARPRVPGLGAPGAAARHPPSPEGQHRYRGRDDDDRRLDGAGAGRSRRRTPSWPRGCAMRARSCSARRT